MENQASSIPDMIREASQSPLGIVALSVISISFIAFYFFRREKATVKIGIFLVLVIGLSLLAFAMIGSAGSQAQKVVAEIQQMDTEAEIWANWTEHTVQENPPEPISGQRRTGNHHCSSNCKGEPTRTTYTLMLDKQNEKGSFRNPRLRCIDGPCGFSSIKEIKAFNPRLIIATFDVWSREMTWELTAEWITTRTFKISKKAEVKKIVRDSVVSFVIPSAAKDLLFLGKTPEGDFFVKSENLRNFRNSWVRYLNQNNSGTKIHYNFQGVNSSIN